MKKIVFSLAVGLVALITFVPVSSQTGASATFYGSTRITNGTTYVEPALSAQFPAALVNGALHVNQPTTAVTTLSLANTAATLTLPAAGVGLFHYITTIQATRTCTAGIVGSALLDYTTTNLPGALAWTAGNACAVGSTNQDILSTFSQPIKSSAANTATTIVAPAAGLAGQIRVTAYYYTAQ